MGFLKSCFIAALFFSLYACGHNRTQKNNAEDPVVVATPAAENKSAAQTLPSFAVVDLAGNTLDLQSFKGKKLFVNLWATWCPPCRAEMPSIAKLYQAADKEHVQFVMLSLDNDFETAKKYLQKTGLDLPVFYPAGNLPDLFAVGGIPTTFIFDEAGKLIEQREGSDNYNTPAYRKLFGAVK